MARIGYHGYGAVVRFAASDVASENDVSDLSPYFLTGAAAGEAGDDAQALSDYEKGALLGDALCCECLGYMHDNGYGCYPNKAEAMRYYRLAWWRDRCSSAAYNAALIYRERGNYKAMFEWFRRAALAYDGDGWLEMAKCYAAGRGVLRSADLAWRCLRRAHTSDAFAEDIEETETAIRALLATRRGI